MGDIEQRVMNFFHQLDLSAWVATGKTQVTAIKINTGEDGIVLDVRVGFLLGNENLRYAPSVWMRVDERLENGQGGPPPSKYVGFYSIELKEGTQYADAKEQLGLALQNVITAYLQGGKK